MGFRPVTPDEIAPPSADLSAATPTLKFRPITPSEIPGPQTPSIWNDPVGALTSWDWWTSPMNGTARDLKPDEQVAGPILSALQGPTLGYGDEIVAGLTAPVVSLFGGKSLGDAYDQSLAATRDILGTYQKERPLTSGGLTLAAALKTPLPSKIGARTSVLGKTLQAGLEGAGLGTIAGFGSGEGGLDERLQSAKEGGETGGLFGTALGGTGALAEKGLNAFSNLAQEAGRKLELSAFGAGKGKIAKAINRMPDVLDESGEFQNPISQALQSFRSAGGGNSGMSGQKLMGDLTGQEDDLLKALNDKLSAAQTNADVIIPQFTKTQSYVEGLAGADKAKAAKIADEVINDTLNNTDGTILGLQGEKVKLSEAIRDSAWGNDAEGQLRTNILKRVRADLRQTVEDSYGQLTGDSSSVIKNLNQQIGQRESLYPLFKDMITSDEARNPLGYLIQNWRTSGGFGGMSLAALLSGAGSGAALLPMAGAAAMTPTGRRVISDAVRSNALQRAPSLAKALTETAPNIAGFSALEQSRTPQEKLGQTPVSKQSLSSLNPPPTPVLKQLKRGGLSDLLSQGSGPGTIASMDAQNPGGVVDDKLVKAVISVESAGNSKAESSKGAQGLMQLMPATGKEWHEKLGLKGTYDPLDEDQNKTIGTAYLNWLTDQFGGDLKLALAAYNWGIGNVKRALSQNDASSWDEIAQESPEETRNYVAKVLKKREQYIA